MKRATPHASQLGCPTVIQGDTQPLQAGTRAQLHLEEPSAQPIVKENQILFGRPNRLLTQQSGALHFQQQAAHPLPLTQWHLGQMYLIRFQAFFLT